MTEGEWAAVKGRAAEAGCSASSYVRRAVAAYALESDASGGRLPCRVGIDAATMASIARELARQGANLNQVAHALNVSALAARKADAGLSADDRRALLAGVEEARAYLPAVAGGLASLGGDFRRTARDRLVEIPAPKGTPGLPEGGGERCRS